MKFPNELFFYKYAIIKSSVQECTEQKHLCFVLYCERQTKPTNLNVNRNFSIESEILFLLLVVVVCQRKYWFAIKAKI